MPVMDGWEAARRIRQTEEARRLEGKGQAGPVPVIALTASATPEQRQQCIDSGMSDLLPKPFTKLQLRQMLIKWLAEGRGASPLMRK